MPFCKINPIVCKERRVPPPPLPTQQKSFFTKTTKVRSPEGSQKLLVCMADIGNFMLVLNNYNVKNTTLQLFTVDREDHFWRPGFLHIIICVFLGYRASNLVTKIRCYQCLKNLKI